MTTDQAHELNSSALPYGMESNDFFSFLTKDREEADNLRIAKELEEEKAMYSVSQSAIGTIGLFHWFVILSIYFMFANAGQKI